jgi:hypothetical protein
MFKQSYRQKFPNDYREADRATRLSIMGQFQP